MTRPPVPPSLISILSEQLFFTPLQTIDPIEMKKKKKIIVQTADIDGYITRGRPRGECYLLILDQHTHAHTRPENSGEIYRNIAVLDKSK
jgi:hypothetical protein